MPKIGTWFSKQCLECRSRQGELADTGWLVAYAAGDSLILYTLQHLHLVLPNGVRDLLAVGSRVLIASLYGS